MSKAFGSVEQLIKGELMRGVKKTYLEHKALRKGLTKKSSIRKQMRSMISLEVPSGGKPNPYNTQSHSTLNDSKESFSTSGP